MDLAALRTEFLARGFNDFEASASNTRKDAFLNRAYHRICNREAWPFLETVATGASPLTISDLRAVLSVVDTTNDRPLFPEDIRSLREIDPGLNDPGTPDWWYRSSATVIATWPTTSVSLSVRYLKVPADLSSSGDTPVIPTRFHYAIVEGAAEMGFRARNNLEMADACRTALEETILEMTDSLLSVEYDQTPSTLLSGSTDW